MGFLDIGIRCVSDMTIMGGGWKRLEVELSLVNIVWLMKVYGYNEIFSVEEIFSNFFASLQ